MSKSIKSGVRPYSILVERVKTIAFCLLRFGNGDSEAFDRSATPKESSCED
jgi:hypothetical protein